MSAVTLEDLWNKWAEALIAEYTLAHARGHMDASHDVEADYRNTIEAGADAYYAWVRNAPGGGRYAWDDEPVDDLSWETEFAALVYMTARDHGMPAAMLMKLSHIKGEGA